MMLWESSNQATDLTMDIFQDDAKDERHQHDVARPGLQLTWCQVGRVQLWCPDECRTNAKKLVNVQPAQLHIWEMV